MKRSIALLIAMTWSTRAAASMNFPAAVDQHLKLTGAAVIEKAVAPPDGCLLCHVTETGGIGTNNAFGAELRHAGAVGRLASTVGPALDALSASDPRAIEDILMGIDPNNDTGGGDAGAGAREALPPQPEYGCSIGTPWAPREAAWSASLIVIALFGWTFRTRSRCVRQRSQ